MDEDSATQLTQNVLDPRRVGRNNSGLCAADCSDVICILHPCTPAAFRLVTETARRAPQHVLHLENQSNATEGSPSLLEEQETFILNEDAPQQGLDLAIRFSSRTVSPHLGFVFGRNRDTCDVVVSTDAYKRVSNTHFTIFVNIGRVLMLRDMSTNGTMVDDVLLKGKGATTPTRMLNNGSIIQILSPNKEEVLRFIVRIPNRDGYEMEYDAKFEDYIQRCAEAEMKYRMGNPKGLMLEPRANTGRPHENNRLTSTVKAPIIRNAHGMHWNGGERYNVVSFIGKGAFASVYQLATKSDGKLFAAKELEKRRFMKNGILDRKLENEMQIMQQIDHPHIVQYVDYQDQKDHLYIIMEYIGCGDLQQYLATNGALSEPMAKQMASQVFDALEYLHRKKITHRDIKPDNLLLVDQNPSTFSVKLSDFGLSKVVKDNDTFLKTFCGTLLYCAPEVFPHYDNHVSSKGLKRTRWSAAQPPAQAHIYSSAVDVWSFGAVLWYSLCLRPPFEGISDATGRGMFDRIMSTPLDVSDLMMVKVSGEAIELLVKMLNVDPTARPAPFYCLHDPWFGKQVPALPAHMQVGLGLGAIREEHESRGSHVHEPDLAALSLNEPPRDITSEVSINSADLDFFDPRQSKRFKLDELLVVDREGVVHSSPELYYQTVPVIRDVASNGHLPVASPSAVTKPAKLFGEISRSDLQQAIYPPRSVPAVDRPPQSSSESEEIDRLPNNEQNAQPLQQATAGASPSLLGAESLVREMQVDSVHSDDSLLAAVKEATSSKHGSNVQSANSGSKPPSAAEVTPKPITTARFNRQIPIAIPPSFYYDPADPSTHNLEYASKKSGHDYVNQPIRYMDEEEALTPPSKSSSSRSRSDETKAITTIPPAAPSAPSTAAASSQARYGRLVSTPESFAQVTIDLHSRVTKWGRASTNTHVYPDPADTRVAKVGIVLCFHANGIEAVDAAGGDWTAMPGLHCELLTHGAAGLTVNGVRLRKPDGPDRMPFGKVRSGDRIVVWAPRDGHQPGLEFVVELFYGEGARPRTKHDPPFHVEIDELVEIETSQREPDGTVKRIRHWAPTKA